MSPRILLSLCLTLLLVMVASCSQCSEGDERRRPAPTREQFIRYNRHLVRCDSICIVKYSDSLGLNPQPTPKSLWITIHEHETGEPLQNGDKISLQYVVTTLLNDTIYTSAHSGPANLTVGQADLTMGLDEALRTLHRGDSATVIVIPEKAYGFRGDGKAIRGRKILRFDIRILKQ